MIINQYTMKYAQDHGFLRAPRCFNDQVLVSPLLSNIVFNKYVFGWVQDTCEQHLRRTYRNTRG